MKFTYDENRLTLEADESERAELRETLAERPDYFGTNGHEYEFCEGITANSELEWIDAEWCGDLTDAAILGITGSEDIPESKTKGFTEPHYGWRNVGRWDGENQFAPILQRWGYEPYQVRSFLTDLMDTGKAVFLSTW